VFWQLRRLQVSQTYRWKASRSAVVLRHSTRAGIRKCGVERSLATLFHKVQWRGITRVRSYGLASVRARHSQGAFMRLLAIALVRCGDLETAIGDLKGNLSTEDARPEHRDLIERGRHVLSSQVDGHSASGMYGQLITVVPDLRAVIVISSRASDTPPSIEDHLAMMDAAIVPGLS
jgi:hypothetical protein